jgi:hypothetical protein
MNLPLSASPASKIDYCRCAWSPSEGMVILKRMQAF